MAVLSLSIVCLILILGVGGWLAIRDSKAGGDPAWATATGRQLAVHWLVLLAGAIVVLSSVGVVAAVLVFVATHG